MALSKTVSISPTQASIAASDKKGIKKRTYSGRNLSLTEI